MHLFVLAWREQDLERKEAPKTGYEINERVGTSRRVRFTQAIACAAVLVAMALLARRRGWKIMETLRVRMREQLGR